MTDGALPLQQRQAITWILWAIWKNRNSILYAETQVPLDVQVQQVREETRLWHELNKPEGNAVITNGIHDENRKWEPPINGFMKCNIHVNWRNAKLHSGGSFIIRDSSGNVLHHARDAFTFSPNRLTAELRCLEWAFQSMKDLGYQEVVISSDLHDLLQAIQKVSDWPRFRIILQRIQGLCSQFSLVAFEGKTKTSNRIAREIARSVLRDGRFQSYLALGRPAWLQHLINGETGFSHS